MGMIDTHSIAYVGFKNAKEITKRHAKTFFFASRFLARDMRFASYAVYALCRLTDDAVDTVNDASLRKKIERVHSNIMLAYGSPQTDDPLLDAFRMTVTTYNIPKAYFEELIAGMYMDLEKKRYESFEELYEYCYKVAGVVGLIMLRIFGYNNESAKQHAVDLGIAMQLTNILRDVKEDYGRGRIYLPLSELSRFGLAEKDIADGAVTDNFKRFIKFQIKRARDYYKKSEPGIPLIADGQARFVATAMKDIYAGILTAIEKNNYDVYSKRAYVTSRQKIAAAFKIRLKGKR